MADVIAIKTVEDLYQFLNDKGLMEIAVRGKNKRFKSFQKIAIEKLQQGEAKDKVQEAILLLNKNNQINEKNLKMLGNIAKLNKLNLVLNGLNLCATCAGFAIMYVKLDKMSAQIAEVVTVFKKTQGIQVDYEFKKVLSEHSDMLDCRKKQNYYTEEQMRALVASEYTVLDLLLNVFEADVTHNKEALVFSILSMASMLSVSLRYFDEIYYFNNKEVIGDGDFWHLDHDKWVAIFDRMSSPEFIEQIQDYGCFDLGLNTVENDCFYKNYYDQIRSLQQDITDNQTMISEVDDLEVLKTILDQSSKQVREEIENALAEVGLEADICEDAIRVAVA